jgi:hypothetical protein
MFSLLDEELLNAAPGPSMLQAVFNANLFHSIIGGPPKAGHDETGARFP